MKITDREIANANAINVVLENIAETATYHLVVYQ